jgi:Protein tyrosine and serine/threonine kinase
MQILEGLSYLAERNIAHRDLRSDNVLISKDGVVKLGRSFFPPVSQVTIKKHSRILKCSAFHS